MQNKEISIAFNTTLWKIHAVISLRVPTTVKARGFCRLFMNESSTYRRGKCNAKFTMRQKFHNLLKNHTRRAAPMSRRVKRFPMSAMLCIVRSGKDMGYVFPLFMYLWHAINLSRLDREITPCLPANKPRAFLSSPYLLFTSPCDVKVRFAA